MYVTEALRERRDLPPPKLRDLAVPLTLHHTVEVALGLGVSDKINFCHNCASEILTARNLYSIIM